MVTINLTLNNFSELPSLLDVFGCFGNDYEYTTQGIFRRKIPPACSICSTPMVHNGYNPHTKQGLGEINIGRYKCSNCGRTYEEDYSFWGDLKALLFDSFNDFFKLLRYHKVSYDGISDIMEFIYPRSRSTILRAFYKEMEQETVPFSENIHMVHYDEQHPKEGRCQKYRLTLLDAKTQTTIADDLFDDKSPETIKEFLRKNLDASEPVFIVTDFDKRYPDILKEIFGDKLVHQYCLMHLNKLIVSDFPKNTTIEQELLKYRLLNIFYNRENEIKFLEELLSEELNVINNEEKHQEWSKKAKKEFNQFRRKLKLERRRKKENLPLNSLEKARDNFDKLMENIRTYDQTIQKRLWMINKHWLNLTLFHYLPGAPATNNPIESYYSKSLKTDNKKQFRTDKGIGNQIKLTQMRRLNLLKKPQKSFLELFRLFNPFKL
ncbi:ISNCY-like element ISMma11 family transposase [Methanosarcina mazei]|uniref:Transposase n=4 Tax=Methanosarcina mazei TaxID=2209 RepID=Q8PRP8_METMA|nr:ISNCY-like element ISMma11 family transposase [Methanosarcina mazei]AAM30894.1 Transposase [Methanosarcina mazei Go1]AAM32343.1 Transposase [Methanosarcina mazei Go1]QIB91794.1 ISNCY-like element ISMma11 family transposase [Methanosarcina mazei]